MDRAATFGSEGGFHIVSTTDGDVVRMTVSGELDVDSAGLLADAGAVAVGWSPARIDLDLGDVSFVDSSGLRILLGLEQAARAEHIDVRFRRLSAGARRLLELTGVIDRLRAEGTIDPAPAS